MQSQHIARAFDEQIERLRDADGPEVWSRQHTVMVLRKLREMAVCEMDALETRAFGRPLPKGSRIELRPGELWG